MTEAVKKTILESLGNTLNREKEGLAMLKKEEGWLQNRIRDLTKQIADKQEVLSGVQEEIDKLKAAE